LLIILPWLCFWVCSSICATISSSFKFEVYRESMQYVLFVCFPLMKFSKLTLLFSNPVLVKTISIILGILIFIGNVKYYIFTLKQEFFIIYIIFTSVTLRSEHMFFHFWRVSDSWILYFFFLFFLYFWWALEANKIIIFYLFCLLIVLFDKCW
jgi:hypothetical protein